MQLCPMFTHVFKCKFICVFKIIAMLQSTLMIIENEPNPNKTFSKIH